MRGKLLAQNCSNFGTILQTTAYVLPVGQSEIPSINKCNSIEPYDCFVDKKENFQNLVQVLLMTE